MVIRGKAAVNEGGTGSGRVALAQLASRITLCTEVQRRVALGGRFHIVRHRIFVLSEPPVLSIVRSHPAPAKRSRSSHCPYESGGDKHDI